MMKFKAVYMSGESRKADPTDYIDYYEAENGLKIEIVELINSTHRFYRVWSADGKALRSSDFLNEAKLYCMEV